jgi:hypothetical protein
MIERTENLVAFCIDNEICLEQGNTPLQLLAVIFMRHLAIAVFLFIGHSLNCIAQTDALSLRPKVEVTFKLKSDTVSYEQDIPVLITLINKTNTIQSVWFDQPKSSTGGPAWTSVILTNKKTGRSVLKYQNKAILESQLYSMEQVEKFSYHLKQEETVSGQFSLYNLVVLLGNKDKLDKGNYEMQIFYCSNASNKVSFTVD